MSDDSRVHEPNDARVRARLVWGGTLTALLGIVVAGLGVIRLDLWIGVAGAVLLLLGALVAWRGGVLNDTRGDVHPVRELEEVVHGDVHQGVSADSEVVADAAQRKAEDLTERKQHLLDRAGDRAGPSLRYLGAYGMVALGTWLLAGQGLLGYPFTATGQDNALRDVGFAVLLVLCGLSLRMRRRHLVISTLAAAGGALLILQALLLPHDSSVIRGDEILTGILALGCAALTTRP
jgi:hypothetical protein